MNVDDPTLKYREQHKQRLAWMPWLYDSLKPHQRLWAEACQNEGQGQLEQLEKVRFEKNPDRLVREQRVVSKGVVIGQDVWIGANVSIIEGVPARIIADRRTKTR